MHHLPGFLALSVVLIVVPGPDMALVARNALLGGRRSAHATAAGVATGLSVWTLAASVGLAALLRASAPAFLALRLAGGCYLVYLGVRALVAAYRREGGAAHARPAAAPQRRLRVPFRQGLLSNLANPKIAVFFTTFLPQFMPAGRAPFGDLLALGLTFCALTLAWLLLYGGGVARAGDVLRRPRVRRAIDAVSGAVLVAFGLRLAAERA